MAYAFPFPKNTIPKGGEFGNKEAPRTNAHRGVDFAVAGGSIIKSVSDGKVVKEGWSDVLGFYVVVEDPRGRFWGYCHMRGATSRRIGAVVEGGVTALGVVGNTGSASRGAHLHMTCGTTETAVMSGKVVDPIAVLEREIAKQAPAPKAAPVVESAPEAVEPEVTEAKPVVAKTMPKKVAKK